MTKKKLKTLLKRFSAVVACVVVIATTIVVSCIPASAETTYSVISNEQTAIAEVQHLFKIQAKETVGGPVLYTTDWVDITSTSYTNSVSPDGTDYRVSNGYSNGVSYWYYYKPMNRTLTDWHTEGYPDYPAFEKQWVISQDGYSDHDLTSINEVAIFNQLQIAQYICTPQSDECYRLHVYNGAYNSNYIISCDYSLKYDVMALQCEYSEEYGEYYLYYDIVQSIEKSGSATSLQVITKSDIDWSLDGYQYSIENNQPIIFCNISVATRCILRTYEDPSGAWENDSATAGEMSLYYNYSVPETVSGYSFSMENLTGDYLATIPAEYVVEVIDFEDISIVDWLITQVNSLMDTEIFWNVTIGAILWFIIGMSLFFFALKTFLGG